MPSTKEIRVKIKSVQNTRKITKAMEMVAASKMRKAQDRMRQARPYADKIRNIIAHLAMSRTDYEHPFLVKHKTQTNKVAVIMVTTDKGLAGALNTNIQRTVLHKTQQLREQGKSVAFTAIGNKAVAFCGQIGFNVMSQVVQLGDRPNLERLLGAIRVQLDAYAKGEVDVVYLAYSRFINAMKQEPVIEQLLPLSTEKLATIGEKPRQYSWDYIYEPDAQSVLDELLKRYVEALIYQAVAENMASEQSARMVAMKAASDNAKKLIDDLQLVYNKTRQAGITKEIT
ncbi:MAG: F0F1 ATP synthase subunit gamma, partial [Duodenibacillus sp.]|nr:F0F1 ATP synthase subunit gamma [Duodenibacillus sp.]